MQVLGLVIRGVQKIDFLQGADFIRAFTCKMHTLWEGCFLGMARRGGGRGGGQKNRNPALGAHPKSPGSQNKQNGSQGAKIEGFCERFWQPLQKLKKGIKYVSLPKLRVHT